MVYSTVGNRAQTCWQRYAQLLATVCSTVGNGVLNCWQRYAQLLAAVCSTVDKTKIIKVDVNNIVIDLVIVCNAKSKASVIYV